MAANGRFLDSDGATQITTETLPDLFAGVNDTPKKLAFESLSDRILNNVQAILVAAGTSDGSVQLRIVADPNTVSRVFGPGTGGAPTAVVNPPGSGGVFGATGTYGYVVTATNGVGETIGSVEVDAIITALTQTVTLTWVQPLGATGYKVYRTSTPGTFTSPALITTIVSGATVSFTDTGGAASAGAPPAANTTGGWFPVVSVGGSGGTLATGTYFYRMTALDSTGVILSASLEVTAVVTLGQNVTLTFTTVPNATSYKIYRTQLSGNYTSPALLATVTVSPFVDTGAVALTAGTITVAASFGSPPGNIATQFGPIAYSTININQQEFVWIARVVPIATTEVGNPRIATLQFNET